MFLIFLTLAVLSIFLNVWQWRAGRRFPLRQPIPNAGFTPPVSLLRPLKGCDAETESCLESWFLQDYPAEYECLFAVASSSDPVCEIVRRLIKKYPNRPAELVICDPILGANAKVSGLCYLEKRARFEHLVIADQDVYVEKDFLRALLAPLGDKSVGLVNCFYILAHPRNLAMKLEAVAVNADFWTQVCQGNMLKPMDFALGAAMATTRSRLREIGGFEALLDYLADDYQLGHRIARSGARLEICAAPVECRSEEQGWLEVWRHQLRWARTIRVCQPVPYFFSILSNGTVWPLIIVPFAPPLFAFALLVRIGVAASSYTRLTNRSGLLAGVLAPFKDLGQFVIWALSFTGNKILWRGQPFRVDRGGKLTPLA